MFNRMEIQHVYFSYVNGFIRIFHFAENRLIIKDRLISHPRRKIKKAAHGVGHWILITKNVHPNA